jgi:hypothetical protein
MNIAGVTPKFNQKPSWLNPSATGAGGAFSLFCVLQFAV